MDYSDDGLEVRHDLDLNVRKRPPDKLFHLGRSRDLSFFFVFFGQYLAGVAAHR